MTLRVAHLVSGLFYGGGQRVVFDLLQGLQEGVEQSLWLMGGDGNTRLNPLASRIFPYDGSYNRLSTLHRVSKEIRNWVEHNPIDVLHSHGMDADLMAAWAARSSKVKHISHLHSMPNARAKGWRARLRVQLYAWLTRQKRTHFVAVSEAVKRANASCYGIREDRIRVIPNGVNVSEFTSGTREVPHPHPIVFGFAGRLVEIKGVDYLIQAVEELHTLGLSFRLLIAGTGNREHWMRDAISRSGLVEKVVFLGNVADMNGFYQQLDVLVLPSLSEGMPLVVLEAMSCGIPVIASDVGGTGEVVAHDSDGWLIEPENAPALAKAMRNVMQLQDLQSYGTRGMMKIRSHYGLDRVRRQLRDMYLDVNAPEVTR